MINGHRILRGDGSWLRATTRLAMATTVFPRVSRPTGTKTTRQSECWRSAPAEHQALETFPYRGLLLLPCQAGHPSLEQSIKSELRSRFIEFARSLAQASG
jgi:hypothetical protein